MSHQRALIRQKVIELLTRQKSDGTYPTIVGGRVSSTRVTPYWESELPCINVYNGLDRAIVFNEAPRELKHDFVLVVECVAEANDMLDDNLDAMAREVERVFSINDTLEGVTADIMLDNTEMSIRENGDRLIGAAKIEFRCEYYTAWPDAIDLPLDDFESVDVQYDIRGQAVADRAKDIIEVDQ